MVKSDFKTRNARLEELVERAQAAFERSRLLVQESRKIRAEAEARRFAYSAPGRMHDFDGASPEAPLGEPEGSRGGGGTATYRSGCRIVPDLSNGPCGSIRAS